MIRSVICCWLCMAFAVQAAHAQETLQGPEAAYREARALGFAGDYDAAIAIYDELLASYPGNADYLLGKGQALLWRGDAAAAIPVLREGIATAPGYEDIYRVLAQASEANGQPGEARRVYQQAVTLFNAPGWATAGLAAERETGQPQYSLRLNNWMEFLSNNDNDWRDTSIAGLARFADGKQVMVSYVNTERFDLGDNTVAMEGYLPLNDRNLVYGELRYSGSHRVLPELSMHAQLTHRLPGGLGLIGGYKRVEYNEANVNLFDLGADYYIGDYRVSYTAIVSDSDTAGGALSHRFQAGYTFASLSSINLAVSTGSEVEKPFAAGSIIKTEFTNVAFWGEVLLNPAWSLLYSAGYTDLSVNNLNDSSRKQFSLGLQYNF